MTVAILSNLVNILLDILLIYGLGPFPRLTTFGAGLATALANFFGFALILILFLRPRIEAVYHSRHNHPFRPAEMLRLLRVGVPLGVQFFLDMSGFTVLMVIMGRLGTDQLAASQIGIQLLSFSFMPANGVGKAATTLVGQYLGAARRRLAERCGWLAWRMNVLYSLAIAAVFLLGGRHIVGIFSQDPAVLAAGATLMPLLALFQILDAMQMAYSGSLQGAGDTTFTMVGFALSTWLVFVPLALLFAYPLGWGMVGGWLGGVVHLVVLNMVLTWRFRSGSWKHRRI
jgi:MATE family multidrug resistance protein